MKNNTLISILIFFSISFQLNAQQALSSEKYGNTLNLGLGLGYYGYIGHSAPEININYELDIVRNFTLAPFIGIFTYNENYYYGNLNNGYYYTYHETDIPIGVKGTYYLDNLININSAWDLYVGGSLGFDIVNSYWDAGYNGDKNIYHRQSPLYLDAHLGAEYHFNHRLGMFLDLSTGVSTIGISFHK